MSLLKSGLLITILTLIGRLLGYSRDISISIVGGANVDTDIVYLLLTLPDFLVNLVLAGGLNTTLIPKLLLLSVDKRKRFAGQVFIFIGILFSLISITIIIFPEGFLYLLAPGIDTEKNLLGKNALMILSLILPISALNGVLSAILNSKKIFAPGALASSFINISIIIAIIIGNILLNLNLIWSIVIGYVIGIIIRFIVQILFTYKELKFRKKDFKTFLNIDLFKTFVGNFGFSSAILLIPVISRSFSSQINEGALSLFTYSNKMIEVPMALIIGAATTVLLPQISKNKNLNEIKKIIKISLLFSLFLSVFSFLVAPFIIQIVFDRSTFSKEQLSTLKEITSYSFLFLLPMTLTSIFGTVFAALRIVKPLLICGIFMIISVFIFNTLLIQFSNLKTIVLSFGFSYIFGAIYLSYAYGHLRLTNSSNSESKYIV